MVNFYEKNTCRMKKDQIIAFQATEVIVGTRGRRRKITQLARQEKCKIIPNRSHLATKHCTQQRKGSCSPEAPLLLQLLLAPEQCVTVSLERHAIPILPINYFSMIMHHTEDQGPIYLLYCVDREGFGKESKNIHAMWLLKWPIMIYEQTSLSICAPARINQN